MTYTFAAVQANGAVILRSSREQDRKASAHAMLAAIRAKFPSADHCLSFRTFDGDPVLQFAIEREVSKPFHAPKCGQEHTF